MFESITLRGVGGSIAYGHLTAADVQVWTITHHRPDLKHDERWTLTATFTRPNRFHLSRRPLVFESRTIGAWPLKNESIQIGERQLMATLHAPEKR